jgi:hypothetical protein
VAISIIKTFVNVFLTMSRKIGKIVMLQRQDAFKLEIGVKTLHSNLKCIVCKMLGILCTQPELYLHKDKTKPIYL